MFYRGFLAGHLPASVTERLTGIAAKNAEDLKLLIEQYWEASRSRDSEQADRIYTQMAPYLNHEPVNPIGEIIGGVGGRISVNENRLFGS
jgi:hypothetical protein